MDINQDSTQLREELTLCRAIIDTMKEGVVVQDTDGQIVMCNPAAENILGLTAAQMLGLSSIDSQWPIVREDSSPFPREMHPVLRALRTGEPQSDVMMGIQKPDGTQMWVVVNCQPLCPEGETSPAGIVSTFSDVTHRRKTEDHMQWLAQFPAENPNPVLRVNAVGEIIYANTSSKALLTAWNVAAGQVLPKTVKASVEAALLDQASQMMEINLDSQVLALTFSPDADSQYVNIYGLDVTNRKRAEKALQDSEKTNRRLLEAAPIGIVVVDEIGRIFLVNDSATRIFGYTRAELIDQPLEMLIPEKSRATHAQHCANYVNRPHVRPMGSGLHLTARHKDGHMFPVEVSLGFAETTLEILTMAFVIDVTKQRESEQLREAMIHMLVHDLRNPLGAIYTGLAFLQEDTAAVLQDHHKQVLDIASRNSERMLALIRSILDVNQLESGQLPVHLTPVQLHELVTETLASLTSLVEKKALRLQTNVPKALPDALADAELIGRVLQNLIGNAVKFTPEGETISIAADCEESNRLRISVNDTGPGIPPEISDRLFQKFVTGKHQERGTGLGLAFCKLAIEAHGESISVKSKPGQGTTFTFTLPVVQ